MKQIKFLGKVRKDVMLKLIAGLEKERREYADRGATPPNQWKYETKRATNIIWYYDGRYFFRSIGYDCTYRYTGISTVDYETIVDYMTLKER